MGLTPAVAHVCFYAIEFLHLWTDARQAAGEIMTLSIVPIWTRVPVSSCAAFDTGEFNRWRCSVEHCVLQGLVPTINIIRHKNFFYFLLIFLKMMIERKDWLSPQESSEPGLYGFWSLILLSTNLSMTVRRMQSWRPFCLHYEYLENMKG